MDIIVNPERDLIDVLKRLKLVDAALLDAAVGGGDCAQALDTLVNQGMVRAEQLRRMVRMLGRVATTCYTCLKRTLAPLSTWDGTFFCEHCYARRSLAEGTGGRVGDLLLDPAGRLLDEHMLRAMMRLGHASKEAIAEARSQRGKQVPRPTVCRVLLSAGMVDARALAEARAQALGLLREKFPNLEALRADYAAAKRLLRVSFVSQEGVLSALKKQYDRGLKAREYVPLAQALPEKELTDYQRQVVLPTIIAGVAGDDEAELVAAAKEAKRRGLLPPAPPPQHGQPTEGGAPAGSAAVASEAAAAPAVAPPAAPAVASPVLASAPVEPAVAESAVLDEDENIVVAFDDEAIDSVWEGSSRESAASAPVSPAPEGAAVAMAPGVIAAQTDVAPVDETEPALAIVSDEAPERRQPQSPRKGIGHGYAVGDVSVGGITSGVRQLQVQLLRPTARLPRQPQQGDAGVDLYAESAGTIAPGATLRIPLGIATTFRSDVVGLIRDRSSMASRGLHVLGGVIDSSYRGEWAVLLSNLGQQPQSFEAGDRIAQVIFVRLGLPMVTQVEALPDSGRGEGGFGSTGT